MMNANFDIECRFFRSGTRLAFNPAALLRASWVLQESGGIGQIEIVAANSFDDLGFEPMVGDLVEVWAVGTGETAPRARGRVTVPGRQLDLREERRITAYGRMQDMASVLMDKVVVRYLGADLADYAAVVASDYANRRGLALGTDFLTDIQPCGITLTEFSAPDTLASSAMQSLVDQASGSVVWGWEIDPVTALDRFYFRPRAATVGNQFFVGGSVKAINATEESQALKNCVKIVGGAPKYPNLAKNSSFEAPTPPDGDSGNLLYSGGFEQISDGGQGWNYLYGASKNSADLDDGGSHSSTAHTGKYYVILDHDAANNGGQPGEEIWQEVPIALNTTYSCSLYCARERGATASQGTLILEGRSSGGAVTESYSLLLAPASTVWTGGQDSTVLASDGLQIVVQFTNAATIKCRVRVVAMANVSPNNGLLIDDVVFADATSVGQVGWIEKYPDHPATPGLAKFNWVDWASPQAAWEGVYGVRANVTADGGDKPIIQLAPGDQPGGEFLFRPNPQQALICGVRAKIDPNAPGNAGLTSGVVNLEYKEWGADNGLNQSQNTEYSMPADNQWRFITVNPAVTSETFGAGQIAAPTGVQSVVAHGDASSATLKISFGVSGTYDIDGVTVRDAGSGEGSDANFGVVYATSNYLRGDSKFERYVRVDDPALAVYLTDPNVLGSIATYGEQEGLLVNDQIVDWNEDAKSYVAAWFSKWAIPIARPQLEIAHEAAQIPSPGSGLMVRVSGTQNDVPDTWASRVTYTWDNQRLGLSLELSDERPSLAKMLKALALQASSEGGGASSVLGGLLAERSGGQTGGGGASAGIGVSDAAGDAVAGAVSLEFARGSVSSLSDGSAIYTPASASVQGLGEVQLAPSGGTAAGQAVQASDARLSDSRTPMGAAGGDLGGSYPNPSVAAIRGSAVSPTMPMDGQVLAWSAGAAQYQPVTPASQASGASPTGAAGGDLAGSYPNPTLAATGSAGSYGDGSHYAVISTDAKGRVTAASQQPLPATPTSLPPSGSASGDLSGSFPAPTVAAIQGKSVSTTAPASGQVLAWNSGAAQYQPVTPAAQPSSLPPSGSAGGDLSGSYPSPAVAKIQGVPVSSAAPISGQVLTATSPTSAAWQSPAGGFSPATVAAPASVTYETAEYNSGGTTMYPIYAVGYPSAMAGGAVDYIEYGFSTSTSTQPSNWTAGGKPRTVRSVSGIASGASEVCWVRFRSLVTGGATPGTSAAVSSAAQSFVAQSSSSGASGSGAVTAYYASNISLAAGASLTVTSSSSDPFPYKRNAKLFSRSPLPYFLAHFDGSAGATAATDATGNSTVTIGGSGALSTTQSKFGGASFYPGSTGYADIANSSSWDVGSSNFTLECWVYAASNAFSSQPPIFDRRASSTASGSGYLLFVGASGYLDFALGNTSGAWTTVAGTSSGGLPALPVNSWVHVAVCRSGSALYLAQNGTVISIATTAAATSVTGTSPRIGNNVSGGASYTGPFPGYIDEMRFVPGQALYTSSFTVPSAPFPAAQIDTLIPNAPVVYTDGFGANASTATTLTNNTGATISALGIVAF